MIYLYFWLVSSWFSTAETPINIKNIQSAKGQVMVAVYASGDGFLSIDKAVFKQNYALKNKGEIAVQVPALKEGFYAVSCFHDVNGNGVLDKNMFGVPTEPYGFSQGARPKFRAPTWEETKIWSKGQPIEIWLEKW